MEKGLTAQDYVHLHNHTEYSVLDGLTKIDPLIAFVKSEGMKSIAITDHGTMSGVIDFYKAAKKNNINPLIGIETYVASRKHTDKEVTKDKIRFHLVLIAMNNKGYQNLMKLSSIANVEGFYYFPRIDHDLLDKYNEGLICLSGCMGGEVGSALKEGQYKQALEIAKFYQNLFGDRYYLEVQDHGHPANPMYNKEQGRINKQVIKIANELNIKVVVTCDAHYLTHEDQEAHEVLLCVGTGNYLDQTNRMSLKDYPLHVTKPADIIARWGDQNPDYIYNTRELSQRCKVELEFDKILIPKFDLPKGITEKIQLSFEVYQGLVDRYNKSKFSTELAEADLKKLLPANILERAEYELGVIDRMGFNGYFLIISDFVNWGKSNGIAFGPGRGSVAGSIIAYALKITELDPIKYDLLFERFLNPDRISMPDIDIDIQDSRRDEVIQYCIAKYGTERVANIATFGRMFARNAVRDVSRVLEVPYAEADRLAKMLPLPIQGRHRPLADSIKDEPYLKEEYDSNPTSRRVLDLAVKLEGTVRSHGIHAAGIVIAPDDIVKFTPLEMAQKGVVSTQYSLGPIEELGLLKMDLLGLSNLTTINNTLRIVKKVFSKEIDINSIPLEDKDTLKLFQNGNTVGVFQFESAGMKRYLKELKPTSFEDIIAMVALYRPGPMQWIDDFISGKHGKKTISYLHPSMQPSLETTYGVIVYQEQVMQISKDLCGFTGGQADTLRKAISKKKPDELAKMKAQFIDGAVSYSKANKDLIETLWTQLEDFAHYCFNRSHAACYALIAYQTAYLKVHYPAAFMASVMSSDYDDIDRLAIEITECKHMKLDVLAPDINESYLEFAVVPNTNQIRFGLKAIKNVGSSAVEEILNVRKNDPFLSMENFLSRVNSRLVNKKTLESLIKSGAFDKFGDRNLFLVNIEKLLNYSLRLSKQEQTGQIDLFGDQLSGDNKSNQKLILDNSEGLATQRQKLAWERELMGIYISEHPLDIYKNILNDKTISLAELIHSKDDQQLDIGGLITSVRQISTKNGQKMAFAKLEDFFGEIELIIFPQVFAKYNKILSRDKIYIIKGKIADRPEDSNNFTELKFLVSSLDEISDEKAMQYKPKRTKSKSENDNRTIYIKLPDGENHSTLLSIKKLIDTLPGITPVVLVFGEGESRQAIKLPSKVNPSQDLIKTITSIVGEENIKLN
ncbi:MAG TPA: DNA polymerase III subunit alpha [Candidatus Dormibacteraeota bacterium]|nr:DNA polymerase III subunit alpha [Candidatus Dormibacteraeota bacterium]